MIQVCKLVNNFSFSPLPDTSFKCHREKVKRPYFKICLSCHCSILWLSLNCIVGCLIHKCSGSVSQMRRFLLSLFPSPKWQGMTGKNRCLESVTSATTFVTLARLVNLSGPLFAHCKSYEDCMRVNRTVYIKDLTAVHKVSVLLVYLNLAKWLSVMYRSIALPLEEYARTSKGLVTAFKGLKFFLVCGRYE